MVSVANHTKSDRNPVIARQASDDAVNALLRRLDVGAHGARAVHHFQEHNDATNDAQKVDR